MLAASQRLPNNRDSVAIRLQDSHRHTALFTKARAARWRAERCIIHQNENPALAVVSSNFLHEHHDPTPQRSIINSHERSDQP